MMKTEDNSKFDIPAARPIDWRKKAVHWMIFLVLTVGIYQVGMALGIWAFLFPLPTQTINPPLLYLVYLIYLGASAWFAYLFYTIYIALVQPLWVRPYFDGMKHLHSGNYDEALKAFQQFYDMFDRHPWREQWDWLIVMSPSKYKPREAALINLASTHIRLGNVPETLQCYEQCLALNPDNEMAVSALNLVAAVSGGELRPVPGYIPIRAAAEWEQSRPWWQFCLPGFMLLFLLLCCGLLVPVFFGVGAMSGYWGVDAIEVIWPAPFLGFLLIVSARWGLYRLALANLHRAERLYRKGEYREGIRELKLQAVLLEERPWIDKWRWLIFPGLGPYSYREWVLLRVAYGYIQLGEGDQLLPLFEQVLTINPRNGLAQVNINFINFVRGTHGDE